MATPKGNHYAYWSLLGPEVHFAATDRLSIGLMSTWLLSPWVFAGKYTIASQNNVHLGVGALIGTGGYWDDSFGIALPFATLTVGNNESNINFSGGWGGVGEWSEMGDRGKGLISIAGCVKLSRKVSVITDSIFILGGGDGRDSNVALLIGGFRFQTSANKAFQFGVIGAGEGGDFIQFPIPMVGWHRAL